MFNIKILSLIIEIAEHIKDIRRKQQIQDIRIEELENRINNEFTIIDYARMNDYIINKPVANIIRRRANKLSRKRGYFVGSISKAQSGKVNTYHSDILKIVFEEI